ncbi:unnamed protein product [Clonostachys rhizophaga]|uniref:Uncharacterized protein n=1 Tax=Clonostachys rhizophaga TaxID=160324 RepID=A0A9N9VLP6_9HYPO|nr:unnamed protein product [Clonostachys rhizophaga]
MTDLMRFCVPFIESIATAVVLSAPVNLEVVLARALLGAYHGRDRAPTRAEGEISAVQIDLIGLVIFCEEYLFETYCAGVESV